MTFSFYICLRINLNSGEAIPIKILRIFQEYYSHHDTLYRYKKSYVNKLLQTKIKHFIKNHVVMNFIMLLICVYAFMSDNCKYISFIAKEIH